METLNGRNKRLSESLNLTKVYIKKEGLHEVTLLREVAINIQRYRSRTQSFGYTLVI